MKAFTTTLLSVIFGTVLLFSTATQASISPAVGAQDSLQIGPSGVDRHTCQREKMRGEVQSPFC
ncbi:hypothetical protein ACVFI8_06990 [Agarivorans sp. MS3-6]|uniref:hypothetical protein n=1 Tax=Agarivorans sp. TSD2052 TaxID=2937286 RepID=UPI002010AB93|nr:hypothetical protein [Agarivorans sp. TSD2052]UPW19247.1 hypothetical protein M0C34_02955 [Agarivorans sp. TSD2052]